MKKILAITALGVLSLTSCKKEYSCECTTTYFGSTTTSTTAIKNTKKKAEDACKALSTSSYTTCAIK